MPVDPRILLTGQPAQFDPMGAMLQAQQFQQNRQQMELQRESQAALAEERQALAEQRRAQTAAAQAQADEDAQLSALFADGKFPTPGEIYRIVKDPKRATSVVDGLVALRKTSFESDEAFRKNLATESRGILALPDAMRANAYQIAREKYKALGVDVSSVPEQYDPAVVQSFIDRMTEPKAPTLIDTVDAQGNPVKKAVVPTAGQEFPQAPPKVTYGAPQTQVVNGKRVLVRAGSDGKMYGMDLKPVEASQIQPEAEKQPVTRYQQADVLNEKNEPVKALFDSANGQYVDPDTKQPIKGAKKVPSAQEMMDSRKFQKAEPILNSIYELSEKINTQQGAYAKLAGGIEKQKAKLNLDDDVAEYEALVSGFTPLVARSLGHTGVLTQQDVDSVKMLFPRPGDSKSLRDRKVARLKSIIKELETTEGTPPKTESPPPATRPGVPSYQDYLKSREGRTP